MFDTDNYLFGADVESVVEDLTLRFPGVLVDALPKEVQKTMTLRPGRIHVFYDTKTRKVISVQEG